MEKVKQGMKLWLSKLKEMWLSIAISCGVWSLLAYLWARGIRGVLFGVLNFFTGALLSVDGGNMLGGVIGRTLILMVFNTFLSSFLMHKGNFKTKLAFAKADFKGGLQNLSEYVSSFSIFATKEMDLIFSGVLGLGLSIIWNAFISGNGNLVNTFSCIALFIILLEQFETKSGFFVAMVNLGARKLGYENICGDAVLAFIQAFMAGSLLMPILAFFRLSSTAYLIGSIVAIVGGVGLFWSKGKFKRFTAMFLLFVLLMPTTQVEAGGMEYITTLKQGSFERETEFGETMVYTTTVTDVVVNGQPRTESEIELYPGDKCSFVVRTNDYRFIATGTNATCPDCGMGRLQHYEFPTPDGNYTRYNPDGFSAEFVFEDIQVYDAGVSGRLNGKISANCFYYADTEEFWDMCPSCDEERYQEIMNSSYDIDSISGSGQTEVVFTGAKIDTMAPFDAPDIFYMTIARPMPDLEMHVSWDTFGTTIFDNEEELILTFLEPELTEMLLWGEEQTYYPGPSVQPDNDMDHNNQDSGMSEEDYAEMLERGENIPLNTAIAIAASAASAGAVATMSAPVTSVVESAIGMKKKKGQLCVNGDVNIPTIHLKEVEKVEFPVNVIDGDGVIWTIAALAITPDDEKLVKAIAIPTSASSAEIRLDIQRETKEVVTTYIEVAAVGFEVTGERYFHETMVEVNIEP